MTLNLFLLTIYELDFSVSFPVKLEYSSLNQFLNTIRNPGQYIFFRTAKLTIKKKKTMTNVQGEQFTERTINQSESVEKSTC